MTDEEYTKYLRAMAVEEFKKGLVKDVFVRIQLATGYAYHTNGTFLGTIVYNEETLSSFGIPGLELTILAVNNKYYRGLYFYSIENHCLIHLIENSSFGANVKLYNPERRKQ